MAVEDCAAYENTGDGFCMGNSQTGVGPGSCSVLRCQSAQNLFDGIRVVGSDVVVSDNRCIKNSGSGVHVQTGSANVIEHNHLPGNDGNAVQVDTAVNFVHGNMARGSSVNYQIAIGNRVGQIVVPSTNATAISGNSGGAAVTTDPYCNIAF